MSDMLKIRVGLELDAMESGKDLNKDIEKIPVDDIKVGIKLDPKKVDLSAIDKIDFTEVKRKFQNAFSIEGTVLSDLKQSMESIERIINTRISSKNITLFNEFSNSLSNLGKSFNIDAKSLDQFNKLNDTLTQFNQLSKEAQNALIGNVKNRKFTGNVDDFSNEVKKKFGVSATQLANSIKEGSKVLNSSLEDVANSQIKSATKYLDVQDGISEVVKRKWNDWTDLTTTTFTDGTQLGKLNSNVDTYLNKMEKQYKSVSDNIRKYNIDLHKAISEGDLQSIAHYESMIKDFEALKKKMASDVGESPFADRLNSEFSRIDALNDRIKNFATSQYDSGVLEKQQKEYLSKIESFADKIVKLNKEISKAKDEGLVGEYTQTLISDIKKAKSELSTYLDKAVKDIFPDDLKARAELKRRATDIVEAMDDANNLLQAKMNEKRDNKSQENALSEFVKEYKETISEIEALEKKMANAIDSGLYDHASDIQAEITALKEKQDVLKSNATALASYEKAMKSLSDVEEKARKNTELHNSYLENRSNLKQEQANKKAEEKLAKEEESKAQARLKEIQNKQKQYWEDILKHQDIIAKGYESVTETLTNKQNKYIEAIANDSIDKVESLAKSIEYWKKQKDNLLKEINGGSFTSDFYDRIQGINERNNLTISEFEGSLSDRVANQNKLKEKALVDTYDKLAKNLAKQESKVLKALSEGNMDQYEAYKNTLDEHKKRTSEFIEGINFDNFSSELREAFARIDIESGLIQSENIAKINDKLRDKLVKDNEKLQKSLINEYREISKAITSKEGELVKAFANDSTHSAEALEMTLERLYKQHNETISKIKSSNLADVLKAQMDEIDAIRVNKLGEVDGKIADNLEKENLKQENQAISELLAQYRKNATELSRLKKEMFTAEEGSETFKFVQTRIDALNTEQQEIRDSIKSYSDYADALKRINNLQSEINAKDELAQAKNVDRIAKETGQSEEDILNKIAKEREKIAKLVEKEQSSVIDVYEKYAKLVSQAEKQYLTAVVNEDEATAQALEKVIDRYQKLKSDILLQINNTGLNNLFKDRLNNISQDITLDFNVHAGKVSDKVTKNQLKEDTKALKEFVNEYDRLYKQITDEKLKIANYSQKGETVNAQAHKDNLSRLEKELDAHNKTIDALKYKEKALKEVANIEKHYGNTFELGMANVGQKIQTSTYKEFNKLQNELVSQYKDLYNEQLRFEKAISKAIDTSEYDKLKSDLEQVKNKLKEVRSQITSQDHIGKIELFEEGKITAQTREVTQSIGKIRSEAEKLLTSTKELRSNEFVDKASLSLLENYLTKLSTTSLDGTIGDVRQLNTQLQQSKDLLAHLQTGIDNRIFQSNKNIEMDKINDSIAKFKKDFKGVLDSASFEALESSARRLASIMDKDSFSQGAKELNAQLKHARNQMDNLARSSNKYNFFEDLYTNMRTYQLGDLIFDGVQNALYSVKDIVIELDSAMANVKKVADPIDISSIDKLDEIKSKAIQISKEVGMASSDVINSIADTVQSGGYRMEEAIEIAKQTMMLANVGEMTADSATKGVVSMLAGFNLSPLREMQVEVNGMTQKTNELTNAMDMVNHVG